MLVTLKRRNFFSNNTKLTMLTFNSGKRFSAFLALLDEGRSYPSAGVAPPWSMAYVRHCEHEIHGILKPWKCKWCPSSGRNKPILIVSGLAQRIELLVTKFLLWLYEHSCRSSTTTRLYLNQEGLVGFSNWGRICLIFFFEGYCG